MGLKIDSRASKKPQRPVTWLFPGFRVLFLLSFAFCLDTALILYTKTKKGVKYISAKREKAAVEAKNKTKLSLLCRTLFSSLIGILNLHHAGQRVKLSLKKHY